MPPYQWISIEIGCCDRGIEGEAIKPTRDTKDALPHLGNQGGRSPIDPPIEILHQEEHASNVDKWATMRGIAQGRRSKKGLTSSTMTMKSRLTSRLLPYHETMWPR